MSSLIGKTVISKHHSYRITQEIDGGGQAVCYLATQEATRATVLVKIFHQHLSDDCTRQRTDFLCSLRLHEVSEAIVAPIDTLDEPDIVGHVSSYVPHAKTLLELLEEPITVLETLDIATQIAHCFGILHDNQIAHGDPHLNNVLVSGGQDGVRQVRLIDNDNFSAPSLGLADPPCVGERDHLAPELRNGQQKIPSIETDLFALSVMLHALLLRKFPYEDWGTSVDECFAIASRGGWLYDPAVMSPDEEPDSGYPSRMLNAQLCSLFRRGLSADPATRPSALGWRGALVKALHSVVACPACGSQLILDSARAADGCPVCGESFPVLKISGAFGTISLEKSVTILGREMLGGDQSVSTRHAAVHRLGPEFRLEDLNSLNGVWKLTDSNGWVRLQSGPEPNQKPLIQVGDRLRFGAVEVSV